MILYHYTCQRAAACINASGLLIPQPQDLHDGDPALWLTSVPVRRPDMMRALGLTWHTSRAACADLDPICSPVRAKFAVNVHDEDDQVVPLYHFLKRFPDLQKVYEALPGAVLHTWWVSYVSLPLYRKPVRVGAGVAHA